MTWLRKLFDRLHSRWHPTQTDMDFMPKNGRQVWLDPTLELGIREVCREEIARLMALDDEVE